MFKSILEATLLILIIQLITVTSSGQSAWPSKTWASAVNLTSVMSSSGITELSSLYWNNDLNRLYSVSNDGVFRVLQLNLTTNTFTQIGSISNLGGPEGITQVNNLANEFYTVDESSYQIRKYTHNATFGNSVLDKYWNLLDAPSSMSDTDNDGPEGIAFIPDSYLSSVGFVSSVTGKTYTSVKGMGGLIFIAHQNKGYIWVFDLNPLISNNFAFVGKYKTAESESCDLSFDPSTGLLYILHNTGDNYLEVTNLKTTVSSGTYKFVALAEYQLPSTSGSDNTEGFAMTPKCADSTNVSAWICRDIASDESTTLKTDALRWFKPFNAPGNCLLHTDINPLQISAISISVFPNPAHNNLHVSFSLPIENNMTASIVDVSGRSIVRFDLEQEQQVQNLDISGLYNGMYLLIVRKNNQTIYTFRFVKQ